MTAPIRRVRRRRNLGVADLATHAVRTAPEIELGWNNLLDELRDSGWPARSPEGDRKPGRGHVCDDACGDPCDEVPVKLDYADPTGSLVDGLYAKHGDLLALQDHLHVIETSLRALQLIAKRHRPTLSPAIPGCIVANCDQPVESRLLADGTRAYVGMEQVCGHWMAKPGASPSCRRHRARRERDVAA